MKRTQTKVRSMRGREANFSAEARAIQRRAIEGVSSVVRLGPIVFFSTATGDAWMLDPEDGQAACLARDFASRRIPILETDETFSIEWSASYAIEDGLFVVAEADGSSRAIAGYPTVEILGLIPARAVGRPTTDGAPAHAIRARFCRSAASTLAVVNPLPDFLQPLEFVTRPFPGEAVAAAIAHREESVPHLLHAIEWADQHPDEANAARPPYMLHIYALFLLAQFRETRAFPPIVHLFRNQKYKALTGAVATENLRQILVSVCGGDIAPIEALVEDPAVDEWVRGAAVGSLGVLLHTGGKTRAEVSAYLGELFGGRLEREPGHVWDSIITICTDFQFAEHLEAIRECYRAGLADPFCDALEDVEAELALPPGLSMRVRLDRYELIDDTIAEMKWWHCFSPKAAEEDALAALDAMEDSLPEPEHDDLPGVPVVRESPKIGRNDQCPCGSGKKYKKCCGQPGAA